MHNDISPLFFTVMFILNEDVYVVLGLIYCVAKFKVIILRNTKKNCIYEFLLLVSRVTKFLNPEAHSVHAVNTKNVCI